MRKSVTIDFIDNGKNFNPKKKIIIIIIIIADYT